MFIVSSGVAKPRHTRACARATFACARAFACRSLVFRTLTFRTLHSTVYVPYLCPTNYSILATPRFTVNLYCDMIQFCVVCKCNNFGRPCMYVLPELPAIMLSVLLTSSTAVYKSKIIFHCLLTVNSLYPNLCLGCGLHVLHKCIMSYQCTARALP